MGDIQTHDAGQSLFALARDAVHGETAFSVRHQVEVTVRLQVELPAVESLDYRVTVARAHLCTAEKQRMQYGTEIPWTTTNLQANLVYQNGSSGRFRLSWLTAAKSVRALPRNMHISLSRADSGMIFL